MCDQETRLFSFPPPPPSPLLMATRARTRTFPALFSLSSHPSTLLTMKEKKKKKITLIFPGEQSRAEQQRESLGKNRDDYFVFFFFFMSVTNIPSSYSLWLNTHGDECSNKSLPTIDVANSSNSSSNTGRYIEERERD